MKEVIFLGLLSLITINSLVADEYISDAYLEEIVSQSDSIDESMDDTLPIIKTVEEEEREAQQSLNIARIENVDEFIDANQTFELTPLAEVNSSVEDENITLSPYLKALKKARDEHKIVMISIEETNCKYCNEMETETLSDSSVKEALKKNFITVYYNQDLEPLPLALQKGVTPNFIFVNTNEDILNQYPGMRNPAEFKEVLAQILSM
jgi:hypothetical protein